MRNAIDTRLVCKTVFFMASRQIWDKSHVFSLTRNLVHCYYSFLSELHYFTVHFKFAWINWSCFRFLNVPPWWLTTCCRWRSYAFLLALYYTPYMLHYRTQRRQCTLQYVFSDCIMKKSTLVVRWTCYFAKSALIWYEFVATVRFLYIIINRSYTLNTRNLGSVIHFKTPSKCRLRIHSLRKDSTREAVEHLQIS